MMDSMQVNRPAVTKGSLKSLIVTINKFRTKLKYSLSFPEDVIIDFS